MPFEVFTKDTVTARDCAYVTIQKKGIIALNRAAYAQLGAPEAVELLFDRERQLVGLRAAKPDLRHSRRVRLSSNQSGYIVSAARFTHHYEIATDSGRRWPAELEDGVLFIDISKPPVP